MAERMPTTSLRLTRDGKSICELLGDRMGLSMHAVIEQSLRYLAEQQGLTREQVKRQGAARVKQKKMVMTGYREEEEAGVLPGEGYYQGP